MQTVKTSNYNFDEKDLHDRLKIIKQASQDVIKGKLSGVEYIAFIERQLKEVNFINRVFEAKRNNQSEVEIYG